MADIGNNEMNPCIIMRKNRSRSYVAWNEDGRLICYGPTYDAVENFVKATGYKPVPLNSRLAATIQDKVNEKHPYE